mgnify:CR=1 FL=1
MVQLDPWTNSSNDKTLRNYVFPCKIDSIRRSVKQGTKGGKNEFEQIYLIPDTSHADAIRFLNAWLTEEPQKTKEGKPKYVELLVNIKGVFGAFRVGVDRENEYYPKAIHLVVMSKYLEDQLISKKGKTIEVTALNAAEDIKENRSDEIDDSASYDKVGKIPEKVGEIF